jgi:hypothetical protein
VAAKVHSSGTEEHLVPQKPSEGRSDDEERSDETRGACCGGKCEERRQVGPRYDSQRNAAVPTNGDPAAKAFFATLSRVNRYAFVFRLRNAKKPETRERRLRQFLEMLR